MNELMRIRRGGVDRLMRRFLAGTGLILLMLLCGRYISRAAKSITKSDYKDMICAGGQWLVEAIWNQAHPAENAGMSGSWPDAWGSTGGINDPDPAYRKNFMKNTSILPGTAMRNRDSRHRRNRESWPRGKRLRAQEELLREGKLSGAEELAVRVAPKQKAARTWQPVQEVRQHPDTRGQTSPWKP